MCLNQYAVHLLCVCVGYLHVHMFNIIVTYRFHHDFCSVQIMCILEGLCVPFVVHSLLRILSLMSELVCIATMHLTLKYEETI